MVGGTILTPIMLKLAFRKDKQVVSRSDGNLVDRYDKIEQLDIVSDELLTKDQQYLSDGEKWGGRKE